MKNLLFLLISGFLIMFGACKDDLSGLWKDSEHIPYEGYLVFPIEVTATVADPGCEDEGIFLILRGHEGFELNDSLVYAHNDFLSQFKGQYGKALRLEIDVMSETMRHPLCIPDSSVRCIRLGSPEIEELN